MKTVMGRPKAKAFGYGLEFKSKKAFSEYYNSSRNWQEVPAGQVLNTFMAKLVKLPSPSLARPLHRYRVAATAKRHQNYFFCLSLILVSF